MFFSQAFAQINPPAPTISVVSPDQGIPFCPIPFNFNQISFTIADIASSEVEFKNPTNLTLANITNPSGTNNIQAEFRFSDQWIQKATVDIWVKENSSSIYKGQKIKTFEFPKVQSVLGRNVFRTAPNSITISAPICPTNVNIAFNKITYVKLGGREDVQTDLFGDIIGYQYLLPTGVLPLSGLSPAPGLPNLYNGSSNVSVSVAHPFNNYTIQVRATNTSCTQAIPGNFNNIIIQRQLPILTGPGTIRCGEIDTKTFQVVNLPSSNNCIATYTWQIANKGWKYNGSVPTTNITTTTPSIQLVSADDVNNPPQSVSVVIADASNQSYTATRTVSFLAPTITINPIISLNFDCNSLDFAATLVNPPLGSFNYTWVAGGAPGAGFINNLTSPQTTSSNIATLSRDPNYTDPIGIYTSINASCGVIFSGSYGGFSGCFPWPNYTVYGFADPQNGGGNVVANIEGLAEAGEYEWYAYYSGQYHLLTITPSGYLQVSGNSFPNVDNIGIYVRANKSPAYTELKYVGGFCNSGGCRMAAAPITQIKVYPNPANNVITVSLQNNLLIVKDTKKAISDKKAVVTSKSVLKTPILKEITQIKIINSMGLIQKVVRFNKGSKTVTLPVSNLKDGVYTIEASDGITSTKASLIIKR